MKKGLGGLLLLLFLESLFFALVLVFLIVEEIIPILAVILGTVVLSFVLVKYERLNAGLQDLFDHYKKTAVAWGLIFVLGLPFILHDSPYLIHLLFLAGLFAVLAIGLDFQVGSTHLVNFATAADYGVGAYTAALLAVHFGWSFWIILPLSGLAAALFGFLLGLPTMKTKTYYLSLVTMAVGLIIYLLLNNLSWTGGPDGIAGIPYPTIGGFSLGDSVRIFGMELPFQANFYYLVLVILFIEFVVARRLYQSKIGLAWNAIRDDEIAAACQGIDVTGSKIMAFYTNAFFDGLAGAIYAFNVGFISPENFAFMLSVIVVTMVIIGGMGNVTGVIFGAVIMTLIPEKFQVVQSYRLWLFALIIIIMLLARPKGLFPQKTRQYA
ncbi:MAG: branched-chain amino acid ABC transporter permease [Desulfobacterota bacterium]|nr:branched-chain amino acid ABC transporter permease [Thermodesulfobacteriota bacterium]